MKDDFRDFEPRVEHDCIDVEARPVVQHAEDDALDIVRSYIQRLERENAELRARLGNAEVSSAHD